jgi:flagellar protein FlgJ
MEPISLSGLARQGPRATALDATSRATSQACSGSKADEIKRATGQFEAIILRQLLAPSIEPLMSGGSSEGGGSGGGVYGYMLTDVLANSLGAAGGLGLSRMLTQQLTPRGASAADGATHPVIGASPNPSA